jgi:hypothetical protein
MWDPQRLTTLWAFTACYRDSFTFFTFIVKVLLKTNLRACVLEGQFSSIRMSLLYFKDLGHLTRLRNTSWNSFFRKLIRFLGRGSARHEACTSIYLWLYSSLLDLAHFSSFLILYTVGRTTCTGDEPVARPLPTHRTTQTRNKRTQTSMTWVGFEPTIPAFERAKTVHALDRGTTVTGLHIHRTTQTLKLTRTNINISGRNWTHNRCGRAWKMVHPSDRTAIVFICRGVSVLISPATRKFDESKGSTVIKCSYSSGLESLCSHIVGTPCIYFSTSN